ncbi:hypothetical protein NVV93_05115 [Pseudomonas sp. LS44]|uniref:protein YgfX n=1 Tax=Pseudomonas sp. LS44 TaxID=1357074 RepID=UPI00215A8B08|nr:protein YgfX [Pseudomonas sp. LS44]UVE18773.1 hypothetical protein NVV93_05115 [Pseudomonas sp. LS44]
MSNPSKTFECRWQASRGLLVAYLCAQILAWFALLLADIPLAGRVIGLLLCIGHAVWTLPRHVLLADGGAFRGLRHDALGWQLWTPRDGWRAVQLRPDSLALPLMVVLRFRLRDERRTRALCIPRDALPAELHRRLRVRLKFSRRRWASPV